MESDGACMNHFASRGMNRRQFLLLSGGLAAALALSSCKAKTGSTPPAEINWINTTYGKGNAVDGKILVAYASQTGSTIGVADAIGKELALDGPVVDVRPVKEVKDLSGYSAVVLGSAVQGGVWLPEAVQFVIDHQAGLNKIPTAFFLVCMMAASKEQKNQDLVAGFLETVRALVKPAAEGRFAGALLLDRYSFFESIGLRIFLAYLKLPPGDYRDWEKVKAWARETRSALM